MILRQAAKRTRGQFTDICLRALTLSDHGEANSALNWWYGRVREKLTVDIKLICYLPFIASINRKFQMLVVRSVSKMYRVTYYCCFLIAKQFLSWKNFRWKVMALIFDHVPVVMLLNSISRLGLQKSVPNLSLKYTSIVERFERVRLLRILVLLVEVRA